jgi:hypothetical protein
MIFDDDQPANIKKLLRAIAGSDSAKKTSHDVIFNAAADLIDDLLDAINEQEVVIGELSQRSPLTSH